MNKFDPCALPAPAFRPALPWAGLFFFGFLMVALNVVIDPRASDVTLVPRLLALFLFLLFFAVFLRFSSALPWRLPGNIWLDPVFLSFAAYAVLTSTSLFFAINVTAGWTEVFRTWGAFFVLCSACLLLAAASSWPQFLAKTGVVSGVLSGAVGFYQYFGRLGLGLHGRNELLAITGLMSNVNLYASFLLLVLPLCLVGIFILQGLWRAAAVFTAAAVSILLVLLQTRAVYLGLAAGSVMAAILVFRGWKGLGFPARVRVVLPLFSAAVVILAVAFVAVSDGNLIAERVRSIFSGEPATMAGGRLVMWKLTLEMAAAHWLTGIGAGNFPVLLHDYFNIDDPEFSTLHPNWLQPHNDFLWVFAEKGILGLLLYIGIFVAAFRHLFTALRSDLPRDRLWTAVFVAMGVTGYLVVSFFDFPMERINHQVYLALYFAMAVILGREARGLAHVPAVPVELRVVRLISLCVIGVLIAGIFYAASALRQEWYVVRARLNYAENDYEGMVANARFAATEWKSLDPFGTPVCFLEGLGLMFLGRHEEALARFERARREMPARNYIVGHIGIVSALRGEYPRAIEAFTAALARSPDHPDLKARLADCYTEIGDFSRAHELLESISEEKANQQVFEARAKLQARSAARGPRAPSPR